MNNNFYDKTKIRSGNNITVSQLIYALSKCPPNAEIAICGDPRTVLHQSEDNKIVCLDYDTLDDAYDIKEGEELEPKKFTDVFVIED